jgi:2'-5' RNA ligase
MRKSNAIIYWLVPARPERELFRELIGILGKQFDAPRFEPHLTILVARGDRQSPKEILRQIKASSIRLRVRGMGCSSKFTKTLFVRFETNGSLEKLAAKLGRVAKARAQSMRDPHVSLLYKKLPVRSKKELAAIILLPFRKVTFDSIKAVRCTLPIRNRADVESWEVVATKALRR